MPETFTDPAPFIDSGLVVIPCDPKTRAPRGGWGPEHPYNHWAQWPTNSIVGILTHESGLVVVDVDVKGSKDGRELFKSITDGVELPTPIQSASGKGYHYVWDDYDGIGNGSLGPGIDVRGNKPGYVIAYAPAETYAQAAILPRTLADRFADIQQQAPEPQAGEYFNQPTVSLFDALDDPQGDSRSERAAYLINASRRSGIPREATVELLRRLWEEAEEYEHDHPRKGGQLPYDLSRLWVEDGQVSSRFPPWAEMIPEQNRWVLTDIGYLPVGLRTFAQEIIEQARREYEVFQEGEAQRWTREVLFDDEEIEKEIIEGLWVVGQPATIAGYSGHGKTTIIMQIEAALVHGTNIFGYFPVVGSWRVVRIDGENTKLGMRRNVAARGLEVAMDEDRYVLYSTKDSPKRLDTEGGEEWLRHRLDEIDAGPDTILVLDNLERLSIIENPNQTTEYNKFCNTIRRIAGDYNVAGWLLVQHGPRGEESFRPINSQAAENNFATIIGIKRSGDNSILKVVKNRDGGKQPTIKLDWDYENWRHTPNSLQSAFSTDTVETFIIDKINLAGGQVQQLEFIRTLPADHRTDVRNTIDRLVEHGQLQRSGKGVKGDPVVLRVYAR